MLGTFLPSYLPYVVAGLVTGAVYGLAGTGLVLTFKTSGIFNFAYGAVAALGVFVFYWLHVTESLAWPLAAATCVFVLAPVEGVLFELLGRILERQGTAAQVVATVGLLLIVIGLGGIWYGTQEIAQVPQFLPAAEFSVGGTEVTWAQVIVLVVALLGAGTLSYFFRHFRMGIAMRAVVDNPDLMDMSGESPARVRRWAWVIGTVFATVAGLLIAPSLGLDATVITLLVVQAFGAAAIGYFQSLPLTFVGGLVIGLLASFGAKYSIQVTWLNGLPAGIPFIVLFLVLIFMPTRKLVQRRGRPTMLPARPWHAPTRVRMLGGVLAVAAFAVFPTALGWNISTWTTVLVDVPLFLSVGLLARTAGQISLCQYTFAAIGAAAFGHFAGDWHIPWLISLILAAVIVIPVGALVAIPAIRLPGVFLALATLGLAIFVGNVFYSTGLMFGVTSAGVKTPQPDIAVFGLRLNSPDGFYFLVLLIAVLATLTVVAIESSRMGRMLRALGDSPIVLQVQGLNVNVIRTVVFCLSAAMAGVAGVLIGAQYQFALSGQFEWFASVQIVVLVLIIFGGTPWYAVIAALGLGLITGYTTSNNVDNYLSIAFGLGALAYVYGIYRGRSSSVPDRVKAMLESLDTRLRLRPISDEARELERRAVQAVPETRPIITGHARSADHAASGLSPKPEGLSVSEIVVDYGGVRALSSVTLQAPLGRITGLIGPNGAGKTTLFNTCSGLLRPRSGRVHFNGTDVTGMGMSRRAQMGLGRTFQRTELLDSLTVRDNVAVGSEAGLAGGNPYRQVVAKRGDSSTVADAVAEAMSLTGIEELADRPALRLTTGQRRLVELARVLAGSFDVVLLDEPCAGLDNDESVHLGEILQEVVARRGIGVLLVEHDVGLVRRVCEEIFVLDFGELIFEGDPAKMMDSELVRTAYLGTEAGPEPLVDTSGAVSVDGFQP